MASKSGRVKEDEVRRGLSLGEIVGGWLLSLVNERVERSRARRPRLFGFERSTELSWRSVRLSEAHENKGDSFDVCVFVRMCAPHCPNSAYLTLVQFNDLISFFCLPAPKHSYIVQKNLSLLIKVRTLFSRFQKLRLAVKFARLNVTEARFQPRNQRTTYND